MIAIAFSPLFRRGRVFLCFLGYMRLSLLLIFSIVIVGCNKDSIGLLPHFQDISYKHDYKVEPYIRSAVALQKMGFERACHEMMINTRRDKDCEQLYVLCRMLFNKRGASDFRRPWIGGAVFLGGTDYSDWPLEPIELVDGVPFIIIRGYSVHGALPEPPEAYLNYCITNCDWNTFRYHLKSRDELKEALNKLLISKKWKRPLERQELEILTEQIK